MKRKIDQVKTTPRAKAEGSATTQGPAVPVTLTKSQKKRQRKQRNQEKQITTATPSAVTAQPTKAGQKNDNTQITQNQGKNQKITADQKSAPKNDSSRTSLFTSPDSCLQWMIGSSVTIGRFFAEHWEKKPLLVKRKDRKVDGDHLTTGLFSFATFERLLSSNNRPLYYTQNLNVCRYEDGVKKMLNPEGTRDISPVPRGMSIEP
jgi:hypothetical protein